MIGMIFKVHTLALIIRLSMRVIVAVMSIKASKKSILAGFQQATQAGPMCEEPMYGICFACQKLSFIPRL